MQLHPITYLTILATFISISIMLLTHLKAREAKEPENSKRAPLKGIAIELQEILKKRISSISQDFVSNPDNFTHVDRKFTFTTS